MPGSQEAVGSPGPLAPGRVPVYKDVVLLQLAALVFLCDQFTKFLVREFLQYRFSFPREGFFRLTHTHNTGSAFGLFQDQNLPLILASLVGIAVLVLIFRSQERPDSMLRLSIGLMLGGATGNLLDRLCLLQEECGGSLLSRLKDGYVTDFMDVGPWPVFNVADASIVTGLVLLSWIFLVRDRAGRSGRSGRRGVSLQAAVRGAGSQSFWCPVCDGEMLALYGGWKCSSCGFKERPEENAGA